MRLICPNCDAVYEVDDAAIPDTGRDVQCSSCGHAWFQLPPELEAALAVEDSLFGATDPNDDDTDETGPLPAAAMPETRRTTLDDDVLAVLREEAEREAAARRMDAPAMETQVEMDMPPAAAPVAGPVTAAARRIAQLKGVDPDARPVPPPRPGSRRELLPDIEEINSTLKHADSSEAPPPEPEAVAARNSAFRSGFTAMLLAASLVVAGYVMAPRLAAQIPAAAPALQGYVTTVDAGRLWLDGVLQGVTATLRGLTERTGGQNGTQDGG